MASSSSRPLPPAFYAEGTDSGDRRRARADWWVLLHPPYTLWHLGYVAIGAAIAPRFDGGELAATLLAFLLAVGVCAHALDELHGRPLRTTIPTWQLIGAAALALSGSVALGIVGLARVGGGLGVFIALRSRTLSLAGSEARKGRSFMVIAPGSRCRTRGSGTTPKCPAHRGAARSRMSGMLARVVQRRLAVEESRRAGPWLSCC